MPRAKKRVSAPRVRRPASPRSAAAHRVAASLVARIVTQSQSRAESRRQELAAWWATAVDRERAAYLDETGEPIPMNLDETMAAAVAEGRARGLPAASSTVGDYTLADVHAMQSARRRERELLAGEVAKAMAAADPGTLVDRYQRAADGMSTEAKKILRVMLDNGATTCGDKITRAEVAEWSGLSDGVVKRRIEGELRRAEADCGFVMIQAIQSAGSWLSPEGIEVARRVNPRILS